MVGAKNYETVSIFVNVIKTKLLTSFFGHGVYANLLVSVQD